MPMEHQSKDILRLFGIPTPKGQLVSGQERLEIKEPVMLKAQIPLGRRGKAGGIIEASTEEEIRSGIEHILSTPVRGYKTTKVLFEEKMEVVQEFFVAVAYDTVAKAPVAIFSTEGGWI